MGCGDKARLFRSVTSPMVLRVRERSKDPELQHACLLKGTSPVCHDSFERSKQVRYEIKAQAIWNQSSDASNQLERNCFPVGRVVIKNQYVTIGGLQRRRRGQTEDSVHTCERGGRRVSEPHQYFSSACCKSVTQVVLDLRRSPACRLPPVDVCQQARHTFKLRRC